MTLVAERKDPARVECICDHEELMAKFDDEGRLVIRDTRHGETHFGVVTLDMFLDWIKNKGRTDG